MNPVESLNQFLASITLLQWAAIVSSVLVLIYFRGSPNPTENDEEDRFIRGSIRLFRDAKRGFVGLIGIIISIVVVVLRGVSGGINRIQESDIINLNLNLNVNVDVLRIVAILGLIASGGLAWHFGWLPF